jgi:DNA-directed RNA polymerase specialized sigma24 family protein
MAIIHVTSDTLAVVKASRAQDGDASALNTIARTIQDDVYRLSLKMLWHPQDAVNAAQEILLK